MEEYRDPFYSLFHISQTGLKAIIILILAVIVIGLIAAFTLYRKNLSGGKIIALGVTLIGFAVIVEYDATLQFRMPALDFYLLLIGLALAFVGVCWKDRSVKHKEESSK